MHPSRNCAIRVPGVAPFRLVAHEREDHFISRELAANGIWEPFESEILLGLIRAGDVFVDLGANIGYYTVLASLCCGPTGRVHAFEPEPENLKLLEHNVALNGLHNVAIVAAAADATSGTSTLFLSHDNQGDHRLYESQGRTLSVGVRTIALDDYFAAPADRIDIMKMDTQGSEARIVAGMHRVLAANAGHLRIVTEFWPFGLEQAGDTARGLATLLEPWGFTVHEIDEASQRLVATDWPTLLARAEGDLHPRGQMFTNLLLTPAHR